jgi:hypothetical protein
VLRQLTRLLPFLTALALVVSGCGSKSVSSTGLDESLQYVPKDAALVLAFDTDADGDQWQAVDDILGKFPFGGTVKSQLKSSFNSRTGLDYDKDVKPVLGNDLVLALPTVPQAGQARTYILSWTIDDQDAAKRFIERDGRKVDDIEGAQVYTERSGTYVALKDSTLIGAPTRPDLVDALKLPSGDHLTEQDFNNALGSLDKRALLRGVGDWGQLLRNSSPAARKIKWIAAGQSSAFALSFEPDGITYGFNVKTDGSSLSEEDLPLASGAQAAPVIRRAGEVGFGIRNVAQLYSFFKEAVRVGAPASSAKFLREKAKLDQLFGVNVERDLIAQLSGNTSASVSLNGDFGMRADLRDPAAATQTLKQIAPRLNKRAAKRGRTPPVRAPKNGKGFYTLTTPSGKKVTFGVVGKSFVLGTDPARAAQFAGQSPTQVPGAKGSLVIASDARALANDIAKRQGKGVAAQLVTGSLGDLIGSIETETSGITGSLKLFIK